MWYLVTIVLIIAAIFLLVHGMAGHESMEKIRLHKKELVKFLQDFGFPLRFL